MSKGGGGGGSTTTVQKADPWVGLQAPLHALYDQSLNWYNSGGPQYYPGSTIAPVSNPAIEQSLNMGASTANVGVPGYVGDAQRELSQTMAGRDLRQNPGFNQLEAFGNGAYLNTDPSRGYFSDAASGKYLNEQNPYLSGLYHNATDPMVQQFQQAIAPGIGSQFSAAGRTGSGAHQAAMGNAEDSLGRGLASAASSIYGNAYEAERNRQQQAAGQLSSQDQFARNMQMQGALGQSSIYNTERGLAQQAQLAMPQFASQVKDIGYNDAAKMLGIGQFQQGQQQQQIDADRARFDYNQNLPLQRLQALNQLLQGGSAYNSMSSSGKQNVNRNPFAGAIGGAAMSNALGGMFGGDIGGAMMGPMGLIGGALLGGLFG